MSAQKLPTEGESILPATNAISKHNLDQELELDDPLEVVYFNRRQSLQRRRH